ncbi:MAG TPA: DUF4956 domain-containing protein [Fibrobacteraceae bacterium]|nr:DUF4956 domain-containing protein [Fibrobacteraceae bacterium]
MIDMFTLQASSTNPTLISALYTLVLSVVLSGLIAWVYERTFHGLSYSRNFVQSMVLSSIVAATVMQAIGDSIARGLGMMGALAIVRFRTSFKDPKDLIFMFASLAAGIASGVCAWGAALAGTVAFCITAALLYRADIGHHRAFDGLLRFSIGSPNEAKSSLEPALAKHLSHFALISLREVGGGQSLDYAYQIKLRKNHDAGSLLKDLSLVPTLSGLHFMMQEATTEL